MLQPNNSILCLHLEVVLEEPACRSRMHGGGRSFLLQPRGSAKHPWKFSCTSLQKSQATIILAFRSSSLSTGPLSPMALLWLRRGIPATRDWQDHNREVMLNRSEPTCIHDDLSRVHKYGHAELSKVSEILLCGITTPRPQKLSELQIFTKFLLDSWVGSSTF